MKFKLIKIFIPQNFFEKIKCSLPEVFRKTSVCKTSGVVVRRCSVKKDVFKNFAKFKAKRLRPVNLLKRDSRCFPVKFLRTPIL